MRCKRFNFNDPYLEFLYHFCLTSCLIFFLKFNKIKFVIFTLCALILYIYLLLNF